MFSTKAKEAPLRVLLRQYNTVTVDQRQQVCVAQLWGKGSKKVVILHGFCHLAFFRPLYSKNKLLKTLVSFEVT